MSKYTLGLDFGTNSVRALIVDVNTGEEVGTSVWNYANGEAGVIMDARDPNLARQHPQDYVDGIQRSTVSALKAAASHAEFGSENVIGIGVDTTGSTPMPVDEEGVPLAFRGNFRTNPNAMAWLWKDHTAYASASLITETAAEMRPQYLAKCGGTYSSEWFWAKIMHCMHVDPDVFDAAYTWVEYADWIPALLCGTTHPSRLRRNRCAAGHKAMASPEWGGYPDAEFIRALDERLVRIRRTLPPETYTIAEPAGRLTASWARKLGLTPGIPVAMGAFDAHLGGVGCGIRPGVFVAIMGTSCCDMMVHPMEYDLPDIPGLCGVVPGSILPGAWGLEAGQSAVGDIFSWFVNYMQPGGPTAGSHEALTEQARALDPGESGLLALDWHNGNRTVLVDQRLTGAILGMTLHTRPAEVYRALIEACAFGARTIMERFEEYDLRIERVINCGGITVKNPLAMQVYADATGRTMEVSRSEQTCALGAAMAGAVAAGAAAGGHADFDAATKTMTAVREKKYTPNPDATRVYDRLYALYRRLHDLFGTQDYEANQFDLMKELLDIRDKARGV